MKLAYQYLSIFLNFSPISNHLHPLQAENCDSNSRFVVDEGDIGKFRLERVKLSDRQTNQHDQNHNLHGGDNKVFDIVPN